MGRYEREKLFIFDKNDEVLSVTTDYIEAIFEEDVEVPKSLTITFPIDHEKADHFQGGNQVAFRDMRGNFRLFTIREVDDEDGEKSDKEIECLPSIQELTDTIIEEKVPQDKTAEEVLEIILEKSRWEVGDVEELGEDSTSFYFEDAYKGLEKLIDTWGGEIVDRIEIDGNKIAGRYIDIVNRKGEDTGKRFEIGKDIKNISRTVLYYPKTALYGKGSSLESEDDEGEKTGGYTRKITFRDVEWKKEDGDPVDKPKGQEWVGDEDAKEDHGLPNYKTGELDHRFGTFEDSDEEDEEVLLRKTWEAVQDEKDPKAEYEMGIRTFYGISGYDHEQVYLGDSGIARDMFVKPAIIIDARITEWKYDIGNPQDGTVKLGNILDLSDSNTDIDWVIDKVKDNSDKWDEGGGPITDDKFPDDTPPVPEDVEVDGMFKTIGVSWDFDASSYIAAYEVFASQTKGFEPDVTKRVFRGNTGGYTHEADNDEKWYFRLRTVNTHGTPSDYTEEYRASTERFNFDDIEKDTVPDFIEYSIHRGEEEPDPSDYKFWIDTSEEPQLLYRYDEDKEEWEAIGPATAEDLGAVKREEYEDKVEKIEGDLEADKKSLEEVKDNLKDKLDTSDYEKYKEELEDDIADKVDAEWVDGKLESKVDSDSYEEKIEDIEKNIKDKTDKKDFDDIKEELEDRKRELEDVEEELEDKTDKKDFEEAKDDIADKADLEYVNGELKDKVSQDDYDKDSEDLKKDIADKAGVDYVDGELEDKANKDDTYKKKEVDDALDNRVKVTEYKTDQEGIVEELENAESRIEQNEDSIKSRVKKDTYEKSIKELEQKVDKVVETYFDDHDPDEDNYPMEDWSEDDYDDHLGDLFYNTESGHVFRFAKKDDEYRWLAVENTDIQKALQEVEEAQETADKKRRTFTEEPETPYDEGDIWVHDGKVFVATKSQDKDEDFSENDWKKQGDITSDNTAKDTDNVDGEPADKVIKRISSAESSIEQHDDEIKSMVKEETYEEDMEGVTERMEDAESEIKQQADKIESKVEKEYFDKVEGRVEDAESEIKQHSDKIESRVKKDDYDKDQEDVVDRIDSAESSIKQHSDEISSKVEKDTYDSDVKDLTDSVDEKRKTFTNEPETPYDKGDIWVKDSKVYVSTESRDDDDDFDEDDWKKYSDITSENKSKDTDKVNGEDADKVIGRISDAESEIKQNADEISSRVKQTDFDSVKDRVEDAESEISQQADKIESRIKKEDYEEDRDDMKDRISDAESSIEQNEDSIESKVSKSTYEKDIEGDDDNDGLKKRIDDAESSISQHDDKIESKVDQDVYEKDIEGDDDNEGLKERVKSAESSIEQHADKIESRVKESDFKDAKDRIDEAESTIEQHADKIESRVKTSDYKDDQDDVKDRLESNESSISQHDDKIESKVEKDTYEKDIEDEDDGLKAKMTSAESKIEQNADSIKSRVKQEDYEDDQKDVKDRLESNESSIEQHSDEISTKVSKDTYEKDIEDEDDGLKKKISNAESDIKQNADSIESKVDSTEYKEDKDGIVSDIESNTSSIEQNADSIKSKVDEKTYESDKDGMKDDIKNNKSEIEQNAKEIKSKVSQTDFDDMEVGGRNLIPGTSSEWETYEGDTYYERIHDKKLKYKDFDLKKGDKLTLSGWINVSSDSESYVKVTTRFDDPKTNYETSRLDEDEDIFIEHTFEIDEDDDDFDEFYVALHGINKKMKADIKKLKLEKGTTATDWTPAPEDVQDQLDDANDTISEHSTEIEQNAKEIRSKASETSVNDLEDKVSDAESEIKQNAESIESKVSQDTYDEDINDEDDGLKAKVSSAESSIKQNKDSIESRVTKEEYETDQEDVVNDLEKHESRIEQTEKDITSKVSERTYKDGKEDMEKDISNNKSEIEQNADSIKSKVESSDYKKDKEDLEGDISDNKSEIEQNADKISSKVDKDYVDEEFEEVNDYISEVEQTAEEISSTVESVEKNIEYIDDERNLLLGSLDLIDENNWEEDDISAGGLQNGYDDNGDRYLRVLSLDAEDKSGAYAELKIKKNISKAIDFDTEHTFSLEYRFDKEHEDDLKEVQEDFKSDTETITFEVKTYKDGSEVDDFRTEISDDLRNESWQKADLKMKFDDSFDELKIIMAYEGTNNMHHIKNLKLAEGDKTGEFSVAPEDMQVQVKKAFSEIRQTDDKIETRVEKETYDADMDELETKVSEAESEISQHADEIESRVKENGVISSINQTAESVTIDADRLNVKGDLNVKDGELRIEDKVITDKMVAGDAKIDFGKISNVEITNGDIKNLKADKIDGGTIDAEKVKVQVKKGDKAIKISDKGFESVDSSGNVRIHIGVRDISGKGESDPSTIRFFSGSGKRSAGVGMNTNDHFIIGSSSDKVSMELRTHYSKNTLYYAQQHRFIVKAEQNDEYSDRYFKILGRKSGGDENPVLEPDSNNYGFLGVSKANLWRVHVNKIHAKKVSKGSTRDIKRDIKEFPNSEAKEIFDKIKFKRFKYEDDKDDTDRDSFGPIAEESPKEILDYDDNDKSIIEDNLLSVIAGSQKYDSERIDDLEHYKETIESQHDRIAELEIQLDKLSKKINKEED